MYKNTKGYGFTLIETDIKQAPFSFFSNLFWKQSLSFTDPNGEKILKHELTHIIQKHTYDKLFSQIVSCIFWINPFYWLIQKELNTIHEFIADEAAVGKGGARAFAKMILYSHNEGSYFSPSHAFFNSSIKRRLIMINSSKQTNYSYMRRVLAFPVTLLVVAVLSLGVKAETSPSAAKLIQPSFTDTIPKALNQNLKPITVTGHKLESNAGQQKNTTSPTKNLEPLTVTGHKLENKATQQTNTTSTAQSLEPLTVTGHKLKSKNK